MSKQLRQCSFLISESKKPCDPEKCPDCGAELETAGLGDCNGWKCPNCGYEQVDIASFKLNNPH